jgi:hypothetical protein
MIEAWATLGALVSQMWCVQLGVVLTVDAITTLVGAVAV